MDQNNKQIAAIYIHVPFCVKKCRYCDFYSCTDVERIPAFLSCLGNEIRLRSDFSRQIDTIYFGGGTPSILNPVDLAAILDTVRLHYNVRANAEITVEMNPGTLEHGYFKELVQAGVNRISIGVQSFNDKKLKFLGRIHSAKEAGLTIETAVREGFENISMDMMFGLPFETRSVWRHDLETALSMPVVHMSCYMLTIEDNTPLSRSAKQKRFIPLKDRTRFSLFKDTVHMLDKAGYKQYEISSYAKNRSARSRHNTAYWNMSPYLGFGPAAHSYNTQERSWNHSDIDAYIRDLSLNRPATAQVEQLTEGQKMLEMIMLSLRTAQGVDIVQFESRFKVPFKDRFAKIIAHVEKGGFGGIERRRLALNLEGRIRLDSIVEAFARKIMAN